MNASTYRIGVLLALVRGGDNSQILDDLLGVFGLPGSRLTSGGQSRVGMFNFLGSASMLHPSTK